MSNTPMPVGKMVMAGVMIGISAIALFGLIWFGLGTTEIDSATRLIAAVCAPPLLMSVVVIGIYLNRRSLTDKQ